MAYIRNILTTLYNLVLEGALPRSCALCKAPEEALCKSCQDSILIHHAQCAVCRARNQYGSVCPGRCRVMLAQGPTRIIWTATYKSVRPAISAMKYKKRAELAAPFAHMMSRKIASTGIALAPETAIIIAIPMHPKKERERGYNQADLLAEALAHETGLPLGQRILTRRVSQKSQALQASKKDRVKNMRGSFDVTPTAHDISGKTVILVDDVITTGATMTAAAEILRSLRPKRIIGVAVAH